MGLMSCNTVFRTFYVDGLYDSSGFYVECTNQQPSTTDTSRCPGGVCGGVGGPTEKEKYIKCENYAIEDFRTDVGRANRDFYRDLAGYYAPAATVTLMVGIASQNVIVTTVAAGITFSLATMWAHDKYTDAVGDAVQDMQTSIARCQGDNPSGWRQVANERLKSKRRYDQEYRKWREDISKNPLLRKQTENWRSIFGL